MSSSEYTIDAEAYLARASEAIAEARDSRFIFYAAFELRCAIERLLFEYIILCSPSGIGRKKENLYRARDLIAEIEKIEPNFLKKLEFINVLLGVIPESVKIVIPNLEKLKGYYGKTNDLLHAHKRPENTVSDEMWWMRSRESIGEAIAYLSSLLEAQRGAIKLNEKGWAVFDKWERGEFSDDDVRRNLIN